MAVEETGDTFAANAELKATQQARHLGQWVLADDSGLAVDALRGCAGRLFSPVRRSASNRRGQQPAAAGASVGSAAQRRTAHYVCHVTLADPQGQIRARAEEYCHGRILETEHGSAGFGYDPIFEIIEYHRTFGELGLAVRLVSATAPGRCGNPAGHRAIFGRAEAGEWVCDRSELPAW